MKSYCECEQLYNMCLVSTEVNISYNDTAFSCKIYNFIIIYILCIIIHIHDYTEHYIYNYIICVLYSTVQRSICEI